MKALILQSGGPTAVLNQSLAGVASCFHQKGSLLGARYGLQGLLHEDLIDLHDLPWDSIQKTPGAFLGSARIKPTPEDIQRIIQVLDAHKIQTLFWIGGNDSAEAANIIFQNAPHIQVILIPKTIDNDLLETDFCPGYLSAARLINYLALGEEWDCLSLKHSIKINICMGRHTGWLAAASGLSLYQKPTHLIYVPEIPFSSEKFLQDIALSFNQYGRATVIVAEGVFTQLQKEDHLRDEFGNPYLSTGKLGDYLYHLVETQLPPLLKEKVKFRLRCDTWGYLQRCFPEITSSLDEKVAYALGQKAFELAFMKKSGIMVTLLPDLSMSYCSLDKVAQQTKYLPRSYMNSQGNHISPAFFHKFQPLVGSLPQMPEISLESLTSLVKPYFKERIPLNLKQNKAE